MTLKFGTGLFSVWAFRVMLILPSFGMPFYRGFPTSTKMFAKKAAVGLGKRQDLRLQPTLRDMLNAPELKLRVAEAASAMLGLPEDPEEWEADDYKRALDEKFGSVDLI